MFKKIKLLLPLLAVAGALVMLPACGKKKQCDKKGKTTERRDHRRKKADRKQNRKGEKRRSFLFRK